MSKLFTVTIVLKKTCNNTGTVRAHWVTLGQSAASTSSSWSVLSRSIVSPKQGDTKLQWFHWLEHNLRSYLPLLLRFKQNYRRNKKQIYCVCSEEKTGKQGGALGQSRPGTVWPFILIWFPSVLWLVLPEPASVRSTKRKSPLKEGFRNASSDTKLRPTGSEMGKHVDLWHMRPSETGIKTVHVTKSLWEAVFLLRVPEPVLQDQRGRETGQVKQGVKQLHRSSSCNHRGQQIHKVVHHRWTVPC